jgi:transcriptional regulator with XRE-family HTH domain
MPGHNSVVRSPTVRRRRLASELRKLREAAGLTIEQVARSLECSSSKISRIETASVSPTSRDVRDMLQLYGVSGERLEELREIARESRQKGGGLYAEYRDLPWVTMADLELEAESIHMYSPLVVPGLLQTPDYARAVLRAVRIDLRPHREEIDRRVEFRRQRQKLLTERLLGDDPPALWMVLDEAVLRRLVGGREVMRAQLEHLCEVAEPSNMALQVLPFSAGAHPGLDGNFAVIRPGSVHPDVVFIETHKRDLYHEDADVIRRYAQLFDYLQAAALDPGETVAFIASVAKQL